MPNWFEKLFLTKKQINILNTVEKYRIQRSCIEYANLTTITYSVEGDGNHVTVKKVFHCGRPLRVALSDARRLATSFGFIRNNEENTNFAKTVFEKMQQKYEKQNVK